MNRLYWLALFFAVWIGVTPSLVQAQTVGAMMNRFESCEGAESQKIPGIMLGVLRMVMPDDTTGIAEAIRVGAAEQEKMSPEEYEAFGMTMITLLMHTKSFSMLDLSECTERDRARFAEETASWIPKGFEQVEEGCFVKRNKKGAVTETVGISCDDEECGIVHIKGDLTLAQFQEMSDVIDRLINSSSTEPTDQDANNKTATNH